MIHRILLTLAILLTTSAWAHAANWTYSQNVDKMTGKSKDYAEINSSNSLDLAFPYAGKNTGRLTVRKTPSKTLEVIFDIDKGQLLCNSYQGCPLKMRFDEGSPVTFSGNGSADHSPNVIFIQNPSKFVALASKARRIYVQANIYQAGAPILEFNTAAPLKWEPKK